MFKCILISFALGIGAAYLGFGAVLDSPALRDASLLVMAICLTVLVGCFESAGSDQPQGGSAAE